MTSSGNKNNILNKYDNLALEASAGAGKTFQLAMRVTFMLLTGVAPRDILCLTFTKKATAEMKERIIKFINQFADGTASESEYEFIKPYMEEYARKLKTEYSKDFIKERAIIARDNLFTHFSELNIKTIDSFYNTILKIFPFEAGFRPDFNIQTEMQENKLIELAFNSLISELLLNNSWKSILNQLPDTLEMKATSIISDLQKYAEYVAKNIIKLEKNISEAPKVDDINNMLENARNLKEEIFSLCDNFQDTFQMETLGVYQTKAVEKLDSKKITYIIKEVSFFKENNLDNVANFKKGSFPFSSNQRNIHSDIRNKLKEYVLLYGEIKVALALNLGAYLYEKITDLKKSQNSLTYTDISNGVYNMLATDKSNIDKDYLYFRLDSRINHLLIDEFQDTSLTQWQSLKPLAEEAMAGVGQKDKVGSFFYVGDPKQNIYRFRDGSSHLFRKLINDYKGKLEPKTLDTNYRSGKEIVDFVNEISNKIYNEYGDDFAIFNIDQKAEISKGDGYVEVTFSNEDKDDYLLYCKDIIEKCINAGWEYKDIAILVNSNKHGGDIINFLEKNKIDTQSETSANLTSSPIFKIIMALAEFIETEDDFALFTFLYTSPKGAKNKALEDKALFLQEKQKIKNILTNIANLTIFDKVLYLSNKLDLQDRFNNNPDFYTILDIISEAAYYSTNISNFKEVVTSAASAEKSLSQRDKNAVTVMTIHKSKGLQFPIVILPNLDRKIKIDATKDPLFIIEDNNDFKLCYIYSQNYITHIQDTLALEYMDRESKLILQDGINLLYVAMTRAEKGLFINASMLKEDKYEPDKISEIVGLFYPENVERGNLQAEKKQEKIVEKALDIKISIDKEKQLVNKKARSDKQDDLTMNIQANLFGSCLHDGLFMLEYGKDSSIDMAMKYIHSKHGALLDEKSFDVINEYLHNVYNNEIWQSLFKGRVFKERKIGENNSLYVVDIYSEMDDEIIIMDYKSGTIDDDILDKYKNQIGNYSRILKKMYNKKVTGYIFHMTKGLIGV